MSPTSYQTAPPRAEIVQYTPVEIIVNGLFVVYGYVFGIIAKLRNFSNYFFGQASQLAFSGYGGMNCIALYQQFWSLDSFFFSADTVTEFTFYCAEFGDYGLND